MARVGVVGTTSWGTTLAILLSREGHEVRLLARTGPEADLLSTERQNSRFVRGTVFPDELQVTASPELALRDAEIVILAVPSRTLRRNTQWLSASIGAPTAVLSATKGLEIGNGKRMSQVLAEELDPALRDRICALSGPNLAKEIIAGKPSSTVIASGNGEAAAAAQDVVNSSRFRVYTSDDLVGVECGGALKNIIALGAGVCDGLGLGDNAKAAFLTRGLAEITRLGVALGANPLTFAGLAGMGDLIATCASNLSRNHTVGAKLAEGKTLAEIRASMVNVAEGVDTTEAVIPLAEELGVEMPIARATYDVLFNGTSIQDAIADLMARTPSPELTGIE